MIQAKCIDKIRDHNNNIIAYVLQDNNGQRQTFEAKELKNGIKAKQINIVNLTLTSDDRLVDSGKNSNNNIEEAFCRIEGALINKLNPNLAYNERFSENDEKYMLIMYPIIYYNDNKLGLMISIYKGNSSCIASIIDEHGNPIRNMGAPIYYNNHENLDMTSSAFAEQVRKELHIQFDPQPQPKKRTVFDKIGDKFTDGLLAVSDHFNKVGGW